MEKIERAWFEGGRIYIKTDKKRTLSRPLEAFPTLKDASESERNDFDIGRFGDDIHWNALDEDLHISSFYETTEPNLDNEVARIFLKFPQINVSAIAHDIGIHKSLLDRFIYGMQKPSQQRMQQIRDVLHSIGRELLSA